VFFGYSSYIEVSVKMRFYLFPVITLLQCFDSVSALTTPLF